MKDIDRIAKELNRLIPAGFTGQVTLHCNEGDVLRYDVHASFRSGRVGEIADLTEHVETGTAVASPKPEGAPNLVVKEGTPAKQERGALLRGNRR